MLSTREAVFVPQSMANNDKIYQNLQAKPPVKFPPGPKEPKYATLDEDTESKQVKCRIEKAHQRSKPN